MGAKDKVKEAIIEALQKAASEGFGFSQAECPVKTGTLKKSGKYTILSEGSEINYSADYASVIERGREATTEYIRGYVNKGKLTKPYSRKVSAREGIHFIEKSLKKAFGGFGDKLDFSLKTAFIKVIRG